MPAKPWGRTVTAGVINVNLNASEGWWEKPIRVKYDVLPSTPFLQTGFNKFSAIIDSGANFTDKKIRLGGRLN